VGYFRQAVALDKSNAPARLNLGAIQLNYLNYKGAKAQYEIVLNLQPNNVEAIIGLASSSYGLGDFKAAIDGYEKALKLDPRRSILLYKCGNLYETKFSNDVAGMKKAISYYEQYVVAARLPVTDKLVRKIPVLKEMIEKGMIGPLKEEKKLKTPEGEGETADDAAPTDEATEDVEPIPEPEPIPEAAPEKTPAPEAKPAKEAPPAGDTNSGETDKETEGK
jgi:tetratricopeptide (TPR) repeat protein